MGLRDLSIFDQALWNFIHRGSLYSSLVGENILGEHTSFILYLIAPLYAIYESPETLIVIQSCLIGLGALPVFYVACNIWSSSSIALTFAISYLLFPSTGFLNMDSITYGFHPDSFFPVIYLSMFYFLLKRKNALYLFFALLALTVKEDSALVIGMIGIYAFIVRREMRLGFITILIAVVWYFLATTVIIPYFHGGPSKFLDNYRYLGESPVDILQQALSRPQSILGILLKNGLITYAVVLLMPFAFFSLLTPEILFVILPVLLLNLLSDSTKYLVPQSPVSWHIAPLIPFVLISAIFGAQRAGILFAAVFSFFSKHRGQDVAKLVVIWILFSTVTAHFFYGVTPLSLSFWEVKIFPLTRYPFCSDLYRKCRYKNANEEVIPEIKRILPAEASLSSSFYTGPHFAHRKGIYWFPQKVNEVDYVLINRQRAFNQEDIERFLGGEKKDFTLIYNKNDVFLYRRLQLKKKRVGYQ